MKICGWLVLLLMMVACSEGQIKYPARPVPDGVLVDQDAQGEGKALFLKNCAFCHGHLEEGRSLRANDYTPSPMDFSDSRYLQAAPDYLYWRIEQGKNVEPFRTQGSVMPAWGRVLTEEQIWYLVAYLKTRSY